MSNDLPPLPLSATEISKHDYVLKRASLIFVSRSRVRGSLWAESDAMAQVRMIKEKTARVEHGIRIGPEAEYAIVDDLLDIINFAVFAVRHIEGYLP